MLLPVLLAPGEEVRPDDIYITLQFFDLVSGRRIEFSRLATPQLTWQNEKPSWSDCEENLVVSYHMPPLTDEQLNAYGDLRYYGFTAKLYYKGEPLDCISTPCSRRRRTVCRGWSNKYRSTCARMTRLRTSAHRSRRSSTIRNVHLSGGISTR